MFCLLIFGPFRFIQSWYAFIIHCPFKLVIVLSSCAWFIVQSYFLYNIIQYSLKSIQIHPNVIPIHILFISLQNVHVHTKITLLAKIYYSWLLVNIWLFGQPINQSQMTLLWTPKTYYHSYCHVSSSKNIFSLKCPHVHDLVHDLVHVQVRPPNGPTRPT